MTKILGISGLIFSFLSVIALIGPNTPIGNRIRKITSLNNKNFNKVHKYYSLFVLYISIGLVITCTYFILIYFSFFTVQKFIFNVLYMGCILFIILIIINIRSTIIFNYERLFLKFFFPFLSFILILIGTHTIIDTKFNNGDLNEIYTKFKLDDGITLIPMDTLNAIELRNYFSDEYKLNAGIILLNELRSENNFKINFKKPIKTNSPTINKIQNECSKLVNNSKLDKDFLKRIDEQVLFINNRKIRKLFNIFPTQIKPNYVSTNLIYHYSKQFSSLAKGSKMYLTLGYLNLLNNVGVIGIYILFTLIPLFSIILTKRINAYNNKYENKNTDQHSLFFMFVSVIGFLIAIWSLI